MKPKDEILKYIIIVLLGVWIVNNFFAIAYGVRGDSMESTISDGDILLVNLLSYRFAEINRFDVVVFHMDEDNDYVKRVIGLPGDKIEYVNDNLFINGYLVEEPYLNRWKENLIGLKFTSDFKLVDITGYEEVPEGKLFVMGDNRLRSMDSRIFGFIDKDQVVGKVDLRYWTIKSISYIK